MPKGLERSDRASCCSFVGETTPGDDLWMVLKDRRHQDRVGVPENAHVPAMQRIAMKDVDSATARASAGGRKMETHRATEDIFVLLELFRDGLFVPESACWI